MIQPKLTDMDVTSKVCIITGANSGLGKALSLELLARGAHLAMVCRNADKAKEAKSDALSPYNN